MNINWRKPNFAQVKYKTDHPVAFAAGDQIKNNNSIAGLKAVCRPDKK